MLPGRHTHVTREICTCYPGDMHRWSIAYVSIKVDNVAGLTGDGFKQGVQDGANVGTTDGT